MRKMLGLILVLMFILSGCVKLDSTLKINKDGSSDFTLIYGVDKQIAGFSDTLSNDLKDVKDNAESKGYKAVNFKDDDYIGVKVSKHFDKFEDISKGSLNNEVIEFKLKEKKGFFQNSYTVNGTFDMSGMLGESEDGELDEEMQSSVMNQMDLKFNLILPTKAGENNASDVKNEGKKLVWELLPNEKNKVEFEFEKVNYLNIGLLFAGILLVIVLITVLARKKKKSSTLETTTFE